MKQKNLRKSYTAPFVITCKVTAMNLIATSAGSYNTVNQWGNSSEESTESSSLSKGRWDSQW